MASPYEVEKVLQTPATVSSGFSGSDDQKFDDSKSLDEWPQLATEIINNDGKVFRRRARHDPDGIATQPSVFDEKDGAELYGPSPAYENYQAFDPRFRWTWREDAAITRKVDFKIFAWCCVMFFALELDRANIAQANSNNLLGSLGLTTADYNLGNTLAKIAFLCAELPSQLISKWVGPDRWIPAQITLWSIVSFSQFWLSGRGSFLATRFLIGALQGGFIPDVILYASYYYRGDQLPMRMAWFWTTLFCADIFSAFISVPIFRLDGLHGKQGWRYLFLLEGLFTLFIGVASHFMMPASPSQTKTWFRKNGYFTGSYFRRMVGLTRLNNADREVKIIVNRVLRDSPSKSDMHNRQYISARTFWTAISDWRLYPLYLIGLTFGIPAGPVSQYFTLNLKSLGFSTTSVNLLTIPSYALNITFLLTLTWLSERFSKRSLLASIEVIWCIPLLIALLTFTTSTSAWVKYGVTMLLVGHPYSHAIQVAWTSRNSNSVGTRTVSASLYNMFVQASGVILSNIYQPSDAPLYKVGNAVLLAIAVFTTGLYLFTFFFYRAINQKRERTWSSLTPEERSEYVKTTKDRASARLDFRFAT